MTDSCQEVRSEDVVQNPKLDRQVPARADLRVPHVLVNLSQSRLDRSQCPLRIRVLAGLRGSFEGGAQVQAVALRGLRRSLLDLFPRRIGKRVRAVVWPAVLRISAWVRGRVFVIPGF